MKKGNRNQRLNDKWNMEERTPEMIAREHIVVEGGSRIAKLPRAPKGRDRRGTREFSLDFLQPYTPTTRDALTVALILRLLACRGAGSRYNDYRSFSTDFHAFLSTRKGGLPALQDIDDDLLAAFGTWLNDPLASGYAPAETTRREKLYAVQRILRQLKTSSEFKEQINPNLKSLKAPFRGATDSTNHIEPLADGTFEDIYAAAEQECTELQDRLWASLERLERLRKKPQTLGSAGTDVEHCAAFLLQQTPGDVCLSYHQATRRISGYARHVDRQTHEAADELLYPRLREFAPYLVVLASAFAFNAAVLTEMKTSDFRFERFRDVERMRIGPRKPRARGKRQRHAVTVTEHPDNPGKLVKFIRMRTRYLREARPSKLLFLRFHPRSRVVVTPILDGSFMKSLDAFSKDHDLPRFLFEQLRPTILQQVHELTGGDITAVQAFGKQRSLTTVEKHYRTRGMEKAGEDRLYAAMAHRHRDIASGGMVSPIDKPRRSFDRWAATPGYTCLDTFDSPIRGQEKGKPCAAYGQCPRCELAMVDHTSARDLAYLHQLRRRIDETVDTLGPAAWIAKWSGVQRELLIDIAMFGPEVEATVASGAVVTTQLPPLE